MKLLAQLIKRIAHLMHMVGGFFLVAMMVLTLIDVVTRGIFGLTDGALDLTIPGGIELVKYSLLFTILFILPYSVDRSQVVVDLFTDHLSDRHKNWLEAIYLLGFTLLGLAMSYGFYHLIGDAAMSYETTQDLMIPMTYFYSIATFATFMLAASALVSAFQLFMKKTSDL